MSQEIIFIGAGCLTGITGFGASRIVSAPVNAYYTAENALKAKICLRFCKDRIFGYDRRANQILRNQSSLFDREWGNGFSNIAIAIRGFPQGELVKAALGGALIGYLYPRLASLGFAWGSMLGVLDAGRKAYLTILAGRPISSL